MREEGGLACVFLGPSLYLPDLSVAIPVVDRASRIYAKPQQNKKMGIPLSLHNIQIASCPTSSARRATPLEPLLHSRADGTQVRIHLAGRRTEDQGDDGVARNLDVLHRAEDVDVAVSTSVRDLSARPPPVASSLQQHARIGQDDTRATRILNRKLGLAVLPCDAADRAREMVPVQRLDVLDLERVEVEVLQTEDREGVL